VPRGLDAIKTIDCSRSSRRTTRRNEIRCSDAAQDELIDIDSELPRTVGAPVPDGVHRNTLNVGMVPPFRPPQLCLFSLVTSVVVDRSHRNSFSRINTAGR